jgi:hypothetical protein
MAFTIPNQADAGTSSQSEVDAVDFGILVAAYNGTGVVTGGAVTAQGTPDMTVAIAAGTVLINGTRYTISSGNGTIATADSSNPRFDLITINTSGAIVVTAGTAASNPVFPAIPADDAVLAAVHVPAGDTAIATAQIIDKRVIVTNSAAAGVSDAIDLAMGTGSDFKLRWSTGDADNHAAVMALGQSNQVLHIAEACDIATDWNVAANAADSEVWIHSSTTPATDYLALGRHTGTIATVDVQGGTTLNLDIAGNTELTITASGLNVPACSDINFTGTTGTNDIVLTNALADALSITDGSADVVVVDTSTSGNLITFTSALTVGSDGSGSDLILHSATGSDNLTWDASDKVLNITGTNAETALDVLDGDVRIVDKLYFYDVGGEYLSSDGSTLTITGATGVTGTLTVGVDGTGHDVKFFGCESGAYMLYDESEEQLEIRGAAADAATSTGKLLLSTALTNINACDVIGSINFQAPLEAGSCDAILVAAGIRAVAQATFTCAVNATDLIFYTGHSEAAAERFRFTSQGEIGIGGANYGSDGQVLTSTGCGTAVAWEDAGGGVVSGSVDNAVLRADGTGGSTSQGGSCVIITDAGAIGAANGTACLPSLSFKCDTDLGIYRSGTNTMTFVGNSGRFPLVVNANSRHVFMNDTANCKASGGSLTINQLTADDEIFALKSSDVAHGVTCLTETDTFFSILKNSTTTGGAFFRIGSSGPSGWKSQVTITGCANTSKDSGGNGSINFSAGKANGTGFAATNSNGNLMNLTCFDGTNNYTRFLWDAEGSAHAEVEWTTYDDYCDIELLRGVHGAMIPCYAPTYKETFGQDMVYNLEKYAELGLVGENSMHWETREDGRVQLRGMVNTTSMMMLHHSTIIQMADRFSARLDGLETQLKALQGGCS